MIVIANNAIYKHIIIFPVKKGTAHYHNAISTVSLWHAASTNKLNKHPLNGLFSRINWVSRQGKDKTILDFNEARDDGVAVASAGPYANHLHLTSDR